MSLFTESHTFPECLREPHAAPGAGGGARTASQVSASGGHLLGGGGEVMEKGTSALRATSPSAGQHGTMLRKGSSAWATLKPNPT